MKQIKKDAIFRIKVLLSSVKSKDELTEEDNLIIQEFEQNLKLFTIGIKTYNNIKIYEYTTMLFVGALIAFILHTLF